MLNVLQIMKHFGKMQNPVSLKITLVEENHHR